MLTFLAAELNKPEPAADDGSHDATVRAAATKRCDNSLLRSTGFEFSYPSYREGYRAVLAGTGTRHR